MPEITFQFSARDSASSTMIRNATHSPWSHVDAVTQDGQLLGARAAEVGNIPAGVQIRPHGYLPFSATKLVTLPTTDDVVAKFWEFLLAQIGKPYDESAYAAFVLDRDWRKDDAWDCSKVDARALEVSGFLKPLVAAYNRIAPCDLLLVLSAFTECR